ncbi:MAG: hypothetical protein RMM98_07885 [Acidobacteriota bacterium]|nr:hypothetical protein [Blastocatellia bacterium]MDW8239519.1 hypothetical protein [Acidobacteriota bacterium]
MADGSSASSFDASGIRTGENGQDGEQAAHLDCRKQVIEGVSVDLWQRRTIAPHVPARCSSWKASALIYGNGHRNGLIGVLCYQQDHCLAFLSRRAR